METAAVTTETFNQKCVCARPSARIVESKQNNKENNTLTDTDTQTQARCA